MGTLLITDIGALATPLGTAAKGGAAQGEIQTLRNAYVPVSYTHLTLPTIYSV